MKTLKVLSLLLCYPEAEVMAGLDELSEVLVRESLLPAKQERAVLDMIAAIRKQDLLTLKEDYVALFDRGRYLSLHLFEHVHGESRDRGQAMVNLLQMYEAHGFDIAARELPDYIPLFLEFLSAQTPAVAIEWLQDAMPVLSLLGARLAERGSRYHVIFDALAGIAGEPESLEAIRRQAAMEHPDETLSNMDAIWEEEAVSFMASDQPCGKQSAPVSPVRVTPREDSLKSPYRSL